MLTKFVNVFDNCKLRIRKHYLVSLSYVLLHLLTLRLFDNPAPVTKRVSTFLLILFIISIHYSYLSMATIHWMHNNFVCEGLITNASVCTNYNAYACSGIIQYYLTWSFSQQTRSVILAIHSNILYIYIYIYIYV